MKPVWAAFPDIPWGSIGWRMGSGEDYCGEWRGWYCKLDELDKRAYKNQWPEPEPWKGFYDFIDHGTTPPWVGQRRDEIKLAAVPPNSNETEITSPRRVQGLIKYYFKAPPVSIRARDEDFDALYCDPSGYVWGVRFPLEGSPILKRYSGYLIGGNNLEVKQPIT